MNTIIELRSGEIVHRTAAAANLFGTIEQEPTNGVYLVARTYHSGFVLELDAHFDRMERSAAAFGRSITIPREGIRQILRDEQTRRNGADIRFRVTAVLEEPLWYRITIEDVVEIAPEVLRRGVVCSVARNAARENATVKTTEWMHTRQALRTDGTVYEILLTDSRGFILEGASSNFYALREGVLHTAGSGVLEGIARAMVLHVAPQILPISMTPVSLTDLADGTIEEAFISSATRGIIPVRQIDSTSLGPPGRYTQQIRHAWNRQLEAQLLPL